VGNIKKCLLFFLFLMGPDCGLGLQEWDLRIEHHWGRISTPAPGLRQAYMGHIAMVAEDSKSRVERFRTRQNSSEV
jgi:hypothetical protein